jgi:hypothetical protein
MPTVGEPTGMGTVRYTTVNGEVLSENRNGVKQDAHDGKYGREDWDCNQTASERATGSFS